MIEQLGSISMKMYWCDCPAIGLAGVWLAALFKACLSHPLNLVMTYKHSLVIEKNAKEYLQGELNG